MSNPNDSKDIFFRKNFIFLIQYSLESKVFSWLKEKFDVEVVTTKKGKLVIVEEKDHDEQE